jgi:hypothetical protein
MEVQVSSNISTRPFIVDELPLSLRKDTETIKQDAGRSSDLLSKTLMGRFAVLAAVTAAADAGNTGDGTITIASVVGLDTLGNKVLPKIGTYTFELTAALVGKITDPNGVDIVTGIALNDGTTTVIQYAGLIFTITDGAVAFIAGDKFTIITAADGDWTPYNAASVLGADKPQGIYDPEGNLGDIASADIVAGDVTDVPILIFGARFDQDQLVIEDSGSLSDLVSDTGLTVEEYLRKVSLVAQATISASSPENA